LPHRIVMSYDAIADGITAGQAVRQVLQNVPLPQVAPRQRASGASQQLVYGQTASQQPGGSSGWERSA
jgi:MoxR-like ATPase